MRGTINLCINFFVLLGQGQGPAAEEAILEAAENGSWVILQNCHLAEKWMERLVKVWEDQLLSDESKIHSAFRLWLTCYATPNFPSQLLQSGVKVRISLANSKTKKIL